MPFGMRRSGAGYRDLERWLLERGAEVPTLFDTFEWHSIGKSGGYVISICIPGLALQRIAAQIMYQCGTLERLNCSATSSMERMYL